MSALFNFCERFLLGTFIEQEHWRLFSDTNKSLTLSNTKGGMDLGTLVVPFSQTFYLLHILEAWPPLQGRAEAITVVIEMSSNLQKCAIIDILNLGIEKVLLY